MKILFSSDYKILDGLDLIYADSLKTLKRIKMNDRPIDCLTDGLTASLA